LSAYIVANLTIHEPKIFRQYRKEVVPTVEKYGGKYLVIDIRADDLDGESRPLLLLGQFESVEAARRWYNSPEYQEIIHLRTSSTEGWVRLTKQLPSLEDDCETQQIADGHLEWNERKR
jgi:uncharacterized protein (DUF1330 family)